MASADKPIRVIQMGLGPIGQRTVNYLAERDGVELVGALDIDPEKVGKDAGTLSGTRVLGVVVSADAAAVLALDADVVLLTTVSSLAKAEPQIEKCLRAGKAVVSTCEELANPWATAPDISARLDALAQECGAVILGTGVNPGFLMDALPIFLTSVCKRVDKVLVERYQDASIRRLPFQQKIGAGLSPDEFAKKHQDGTIRHVGFTESIRLIAATLGWQLESVTDEVQPVIAEKPTSSQFIQVAAGQCAGLRQLGQGYRKGDATGEASITLELQAYLGHPAPRDTVTLTGEPTIRSNIEGGVDGDIATCSMAINALKAVLLARPGLRTMADVPLTHWYTA